MAGAIAEHLDREGWRAATAGTHPAPADAAPNGESVAALAEQQIPMPEQAPRRLDRQKLAKADRVVLLGSPTDDQWTAFADAGMGPADVTVWRTVEPSEEGIEGAERMRRIRDDIAARVEALHADLVGG